MSSSVLASQEKLPGHTSRPAARHYLPYLALLLPLLLLLPGMFSFPYPIHGESDLAISHYPNAIFLLDSLRQHGEIPLWSPAIMSGYPFFADPLAGLWYPPGWLALFLPLPFGFNLLVALHLAWGGLGMTWLLRREGLGKFPALAGGVAFACLPKLYAHFGAGHLTLLYALPWVPWLLGASLNSFQLIFPKSVDEESWRPAFKRVVIILLPGIILALIFLADVRAAAYAGLLWWAYVFSHSHYKTWLAGLGRLALQSSFALVLAAPLSLPLLEFTSLSTRSAMLAADTLVYSLPPARLIWLLFPDFGGFHEYMLYPGAVVLVLAILAIAGRAGKPGRLFWLGAFLVSLLLALGEHLPGLEPLVSLAGLDLLRVPARMLFISGLALTALAAYGLEVLVGGSEQQERRRIARVLVAFCTLVLSLAIGVRLATGVIPPNLVWGAGAILLACLLAGLLLKGSVRRKWLFLGLLFLAVTDWSLVSRLAYTTRPVSQVLAAGADAAGFLADQSGRFRTYSPSYSLPQQTGVRYNLELADGVNPLQLSSYASFMDRASGVPRQGYSVTIPPFATSNPQIDNRFFMPDANLLGLLGVRYLLAEFDLESGHLTFVRQFGVTRLYENELARPLAWVQPESAPLGESIRPVTREEWAPNRIAIETDGPGRLVLSEIDYPGWRAWVDGSEIEVEAESGLLRSVRLGPGEHQILFQFQPASLFGGCVILVAGGVLIPAILWFTIVSRQKKRQRSFSA